MQFVRRIRNRLKDVFVESPDNDDEPSHEISRGLVVLAPENDSDVVGSSGNRGQPFGALPSSSTVDTAIELQPLNPPLTAPATKKSFMSLTSAAPPVILRSATERERTMLWLQSRSQVVLDLWIMIGLLFLVLSYLTWDQTVMIIRTFG